MDTRSNTPGSTQNPEVHIDKTDARAGSTPGVVRYVLGIGIVLAIVALGAIWITGAATSNQDNNGTDDSARAAAQQEQRENQAP